MSKKLVLVIEDEPAFRKALEFKLKGKDVEVINASDGKEAIEKLKSQKNVDLLILDILMPVMNGFEFLQKTKEDKELLKAPVVVLSNLDKQKEIDRAMKYGIKEYIVKSEEPLDNIVVRIKKYLASGDE
jgi:two-component system response regulator ResD